jgi:hypothetical protein
MGVSWPSAGDRVEIDAIDQTELIRLVRSRVPVLKLSVEQCQGFFSSPCPALTEIDEAIKKELAQRKSEGGSDHTAYDRNTKTQTKAK